MKGNRLHTSEVFLLTPLREGRRSWQNLRKFPSDFYSRPCGRGDPAASRRPDNVLISTHAPAGGATYRGFGIDATLIISTHAPAGGATTQAVTVTKTNVFLLTPLREGRQSWRQSPSRQAPYFYSRPCGRGDKPARMGRSPAINFYSRPCGRGDPALHRNITGAGNFYSRPCGRGDERADRRGEIIVCISTHAPAGGATAIFHKSVMRFCGKLPKDDTVLCLASFGFPRRDPKAVYLAWISCANLPQKCVRQGLALKDQGTSCFHEGLASHAFDPVLV